MAIHYTVWRVHTPNFVSAYFPYLLPNFFPFKFEHITGLKNHYPNSQRLSSHMLLCADIVYDLKFYRNCICNSKHNNNPHSFSVNISQAIAQTHHQLASYSTAILCNTAKLTATLVEWKDYRDDGFIEASRPNTRAESCLSG